jgi:hypothetical protein
LKVSTYFAWEIRIVNAIQDVNGYFFIRFGYIKMEQGDKNTPEKSHVRNFVKNFVIQVAGKFTN